MLAGAAVLGGCTAKPSGAVHVELSHVAGAAPLTTGIPSDLGDGQQVTIDRLRYYLSNFRLHRVAGDWFEPTRNPDSDSGYYLVDEHAPGSKHFAIPSVPQGEYDRVEFLVGVDDARNHAGAQSGALDPARGLFWTWKSGYIFFQLEGQSPQSSSDGHRVNYHIGGGQPSLARVVSIALAPKTARVTNNIEPTIHLHLDVAQVFASVHVIRIVDRPTAMDPRSALPLADNVAAAFALDHLHHEPPPKRR
jgi:hypothetical protein